MTPQLAEPPAVRIRPDDEYNRRLVQETHPPDWKNPSPSGRYSLVVVGAGTEWAEERLAQRQLPLVAEYAGHPSIAKWVDQGYQLIIL